MVQDQGDRPAFRLEGACVSIGSKSILRNVTLSGGASEQVALIGPSGAGKTTLLRLLSGAVSPTEGRVEALGVDPAALGVRELRAFRSRVGFIHQSHDLVPMLRTVQNVAAGRLAGHGTFAGLRRVFFPTDAEAAEIHATLEQVGIEEQLFGRVDRLSGGEQQRVAIARTLYQAPDLLLADEPVSSVDPERARAVVQLLVRLATDRGLPLVVSLHDVELAREFFPRVIGLRDGHVHLESTRSGDGEHGDLGSDALEDLYRIGDSA